MLSYQRIEDPDNLLACCDPDPKPNTPGTCDCCYDFWTSDLSDVNTKLSAATARADHKQKELDNISNWYATLKGWCDDWEKVDNLSDTLCSNLELFISHLEKVCAITDKTDRAINILFCMIRELYVHVDRLKEKYDDLYKCINCLKSPELESGGLRDCLDYYGTKLIAVVATRDDLIAKVITAIEYSYELHDNICDEYGLKTILIYWKGILNCQDEREEDDDDEDAGDDEEGREKKSKCDEHGNEICEWHPSMTFPIDYDPYFRGLKKHRDEVKRKVHELRIESRKANEEKAALQACKDGLTNAILSVDNSGKCK